LLEFLGGGSALGGTIGSRGVLIVGPGGFDSGTTILKGGTERILSDGTALDVSIAGGGTAIVLSGGTTSAMTIGSGHRDRFGGRPCRWHDCQQWRHRSRCHRRRRER
jgi:autotransporter passenger strand-loop-strand repeat protein